MGLVPPKPGIPGKNLELSVQVGMICGSLDSTWLPHASKDSRIPRLLPGAGALPLDTGLAGNNRDWELLIPGAAARRGPWDLEAPETEFQARQSRVFHPDATYPSFPDRFVDRIPAAAWISISASLFPLLPRIPANFTCLSSQSHFSLLPGAFPRQIFLPGKPQLSRDFTAAVGKPHLIPRQK